MRKGVLFTEPLERLLKHDPMHFKKERRKNCSSYPLPYLHQSRIIKLQGRCRCISNYCKTQDCFWEETVGKPPGLRVPYSYASKPTEMKILVTLALLILSIPDARAQDSLSKTRIGIGLSAPELLHVGIAHQLTSYNQLGVSAGIGPTMGGVWPSLSAEHRLYFGNRHPLTKRRQWFLRQGVSYYPAGDDVAVTFTLGADLGSKKAGSGWTIDGGVFFLPSSEKDEWINSRLIPALRFQYYGLLRRKQ